MAPVIYFWHRSSFAHDTGLHPERAERISAIEARLSQRSWRGLAPRAAEAATVEQLTAVHSLRHVEHVREVAESGGGSLDPDTVTSAGSYTAAVYAAGAACAMVDELLSGTHEAAFCALRPPGHHAEREAAGGFCLFNNIAVAARHALDAHGVGRVFIFDWDVHHGNGTNDAFRASSDVLYASVHQSPLYPGTGPITDVGKAGGEGYTVNLPVPPGADEPTWLSLVDHVVVPIAAAFDPELVLVSAGFDAHRSDPLASCVLESSSYAEMTRRIQAMARAAGAPVGCVLEGGYDLRALAESTELTLDALADESSNGPLPAPRLELTDRARASLARYWPTLLS